MLQKVGENPILHPTLVGWEWLKKLFGNSRMIIFIFFSLSLSPMEIGPCLTSQAASAVSFLVSWWPPVMVART